MRFFLLCVIVPAAVTLLLQSILCRRVKRGILRHGALVLPVIFIILGIYTGIQCGGAFGGLGVIAVALWLVGACCAALGYGAAWLIFHITKKGKDRKQD